MRAGAALFSLDRYQEAEAAYEAALRLTPDDAAILAARDEARKVRSRKDIEAEIKPAILDFAMCVAGPAPVRLQ